jgi:CRISPR-associated exonuclease Cas4
MSKPEDEWPEDELIPVSAVSQWCYCPRRCALIHLEDIFEDNVFTLPLYSRRLGLSGVADVVEFWPDGRVVPVEYKHGRRFRRGKLNDMAQVCAQAMCLEEMLGVEIPRAAVYYRGSRRRQEVELDEQLRAFTEDAIERIRRMLAEGLTPPPVNDRRCRDCSLIDACQPELMDRLLSAPPGRRLFVPDDGIGLD